MKEKKEMLSQKELEDQINQKQREISGEISNLKTEVKKLEYEYRQLAYIHLYEMEKTLSLISYLVSKMEGEKYTYGVFTSESFLSNYYYTTIHLRKESLDRQLLESYFTRKKDPELYSRHLSKAMDEMLYKKEPGICGVRSITSSEVVDEIEKSFFQVFEVSTGDNPFHRSRGEDYLCFNSAFEFGDGRFVNYFDVEIKNSQYSYIMDFMNRYLLQYRLENKCYTNEYYWSEYWDLVDSYVEEYKSQHKLCKRM